MSVDVDDREKNGRKGKNRTGYVSICYPLVMTNIAIENDPFIVVLPINNGDFP